MPSAFGSFSILCDGYHRLNHDVRIDASVCQSQLAAPQFLEIELSQAFRASVIALHIMCEAVFSEEVAEIEPESGFRVVRVAVLEALDIANGFGFVETVFKLPKPSSDCSKFAALPGLRVTQPRVKGTDERVRYWVGV